MSEKDKSIIRYTCFLVVLIVLAYFLAAFIDGSNRLADCECAECKTPTMEMTEIYYDSEY
jgi:hypothetical protein